MEPSHDPMQGLAAHVARLERQMRTQRALLVFGLLVAITAAGIAVLLYTERRHQAGSFLVKSPAGKVLAELGISGDGAAGLHFYGEERKTRVWLGVAPDGSPRLVFGDAEGVPRTTLGLSDSGSPALEFADDQGKIVYRVPPAAGATPQERWVSYNTAGTRALSQGRVADAEKLYIAAVKEAKAFGANDLRLAASLNNLGVLYVKQQQYERADELYLRALAIRRTVLGDAHPQVAQSLANRAYLLQLRGDQEEAETLYRRAIAITEGSLGPQHPSLLSTLDNYAELLRGLDRGVEAEGLEARARAIRERQGAETEAKEPPGSR